MRDNNQTYSVLHIEDSHPIACSVKMDDRFHDQLICRFDVTTLTHLQPVENRYFKINIYPTYIVIVPKFHFEYYPFKKTFIKDKRVKAYREFAYKHWTVVGFKGKSKLFLKKENEGLAFPIEFSKSRLPAIGELDFDLHPIDKKIDAKGIAKIKQDYHDKKYVKVLQAAEFLLEDKKNIFSNEAKLYKIRALNQIINAQNSEDENEDPSELIDMAKEWVAENPSNPDIPEMYMIIARTYLKLGRSSKAKKYLDILDEEYKESKFNYLAKLYNADKIYKVKSKNEAIALYKDVLYNTKDFDIASMAALKLSRAYIKKKNIKKAKLFIEKVIHANQTFIQTHAQEAYKLAKNFADNNESNVSIQLAGLLDKKGNEESINRDELKKDIAYWHEKAHDTYQAIALYKQYLDKEKYGKYRDFISERLDKVMINADEKNETKKLQILDKLMQKYSDDAIYAKALLQKAKIFLKNKQYNDILQMKNKLKKYGGEALLSEVAKKQLAVYYHDKQCQEALALENEYNLTAPMQEDENVFGCYLKIGVYDKALVLSKRKMQSEDLAEKLKWTYNTAQVYKKEGKNKALILAADDVDKLQKLVKTDKYNALIYDKIAAYYHLGGYDELMLREVQRCEQLFPDAVRNLDIFEKVLLYAKKKKNDTLLLNYAKKMISLQEKYKLSTYTPKLELDYIEALRERGDYKEALKEDLKLLYKKLTDAQRAHVLYLAGYLSEKEKKMKEAKEFYTKCGEIVEDSAWVQLCSENLQLLE